MRLTHVVDSARDYRIMFDLESKIITEAASYFCFSFFFFIIINDTEYALVPDSLQRWEQLDKPIYHSDELPSLKERCTGFADQMHVLLVGSHWKI